MRIAKIIGLNFQGRSFSTELGPVTVLVGSNWAGKSSRVKALHLALLGYVPDLRNATGEAVKATPELYRLLAGEGDRLRAEVVFDDGSNQYRELAASNGKVKLNELVRVHVRGSHLDAGEYLGLSDRERVKFLFDALGGAGGTALDSATVAGTLAGQLRKIVCERHTGRHEKAVAALVAAVLPPWPKHGEAYPYPYDPRGDVATYINKTGEVFDWMSKNHAATAKRLRQTIQGLAQGMDGPPPPSNSEELAAKAHWELEMAVTAWTKADNARGVVGKQIDAVEDVEHVADRRADYEEALANARRKLSAPEPTAPPGTLVEATRAYTQADHAVTEAKVAEAAAVKRLREAEEEPPSTCPECGAKRKKEPVAARNKRFKALAKACEEWLGAYNIAVDHREQASRHLDDWHKYTKRHTEWQSSTSAAGLTIARLEKNLAELAGAAEKLAGLPKLREEWKKLDGELAAASQKMYECRTKAQAADQQVALMHQDRGKQQAKAQAAEQAEQADAELEVAKKAQAALIALKDALVERSVGPFVALCNRVCGGVLKAPLEFVDGEVGYRWQGRFVTHRTFSGTEQLLAHAAVSVALAATARGPLKLVVLDELGRLDAANKAKVLGAVVDAVQDGTIDQAIVIDVAVPPPVSDISALVKVVEL